MNWTSCGKSWQAASMQTHKGSTVHNLSTGSARPIAGVPGCPGLYISGNEGNTHVVRAAALMKGDIVGNFESELLKVGFAIIHDKIVLLDPVGENGAVILGSHNLGY